MRRFGIGMLASLVIGRAAFAQQAPLEKQQAPVEALPAPASLPCETPDEVTARVHFERALRAFLDGQQAAARSESQAGLDASPSGRFAPALRGLLAKLDGGRMPAVGTRGAQGPSHRGELISAATLDGLALGALAAGALKADAKGFAGLIMLGTAAGLAGSVLATSGQHVSAAYPVMLETGASYGAFAVLLGEAIGGYESGNLAGPVAAGVLLGTAGGLGAAYGLRMTGGDAGAATGGLLYGAGLPVLIELAAFGTRSGHEKLFEWTALIGGTAGLIAGPLLNRELNWSLGRWRLVELGGGVGLLFGFGAAVLADVKSDQAGFGLLTAGTVLGLGLSAFLTSGWDADEPRERRPTSLLDVAPSGKLRLGSLGEAIRPAVFAGKSGKPDVGAAVSVFGGSF